MSSSGDPSERDRGMGPDCAMEIKYLRAVASGLSDKFDVRKKKKLRVNPKWLVWIET